jgi:5-methylcytosine-specific restriction endonuclease McrBC regulatory subunit McrC
MLDRNRRLLALLDASADLEFDGAEPVLRVTTGSRVGAIPLVSPLTSRYDYALVVHPRFPWPGLGPVLAETGWRVVPQPLGLPLLKRSARKTPRWVLAVMVLARLEALLKGLERRFEIVEEVRRAPRGRVRWSQYAHRHLGRAGFLEVPCVFADLRDDRHLRSAVRYCLELEIRSLETQREHGPFIPSLIAWAERLRSAVQDVPPRAPSPLMLDAWLRRPMRTPSFEEGIQAIEWAIEERGLAGLSDLEGIPWSLPMDRFFEAWVEAILAHLARRTGAIRKTGRLRETLVPIRWEPVHAGTQTALIPDHWLEWPWATLIVDAKYKRHWEELEWRNRNDWSEALREDHRRDLLQVLAYAGLAPGEHVIACLVYPCRPETWQSLQTRGRLFLKAHVPAHGRSVWLWLTAAPLWPSAEKYAAPWVDEILRERAA